MTNVKIPLTTLLQQIGELVTSGEDSGSQHSDGSVPVRLRQVVLALLDQVAANSSVRPREAGSILKLVNLALTRMPSMFGGENRGALSEVLERVLPMFCRPQLADISHELVAVSLRILTILSQVDTGLFQSVVKGFVELFEDSCEVAFVLAKQPEITASVACFSGVLGEADSSAHSSLQLQLSSAAACDMLLGTVLCVLAQIVPLRPLQLLPLFPRATLDRTCTLLLCPVPSLQCAAMQLLGTFLLGEPCTAVALALQVADLLPPLLASPSASATLTGSSPSAPAAHPKPSTLQKGKRGENSAATPFSQQGAAPVLPGWWQHLLSLLHALLHCSPPLPSTPSTPPLVLPPLAEACVQGMLLVEGSTDMPAAAAVQLSLSRLYREVVAHHPLLVEQQTGELLRLLGSAARHAERRAVCEALCQGVLLYMGRYNSTEVKAAFHAAATKAAKDPGGPGKRAQQAAAPEVIEILDDNDDNSGDLDCDQKTGSQDAEDAELLPSARKRRRLRMTPGRGRSPLSKTHAKGATGAGSKNASSAGTASPPPDGLLRVTSLLWEALLRAQHNSSSGREGEEGEGPGSGLRAREAGAEAILKFPWLLRLAWAAGAPADEILGVCAPLAPAWLQVGGGKQPQGRRAARSAPSSGGAGVVAACEGMLVAVSAALQITEIRGTPAVASLAVQAQQVQRLLEIAWKGVEGTGSSGGKEGKGAGEALERSQQSHAAAVVLSLALVSTQAGLLEGPELLQRLCAAAHSRVLAAADASLRRCFGALLPACCAVAVSRQEPSGPHFAGGGWGAGEGTQLLRESQVGQAHPRRHGAAAPGARHAHPSPLTNPLVTLLQQELYSAGEGGAGESQGGSGAQQAHQGAQQAVVAGVVAGLASLLPLVHQPLASVQLAVQLALSQGSGALACWPQRQQGECGGDASQPVLSSQVAEWVRPALEHLCGISAVLQPEAQVGLLQAVHTFLVRAPPGQLEHSRPLAQWALHACSSRHAPLRAAAVRRAGVLASPPLILALYQDTPHPIDTLGRAEAVEGHECMLLQDLKSQLEGADSLGAKESTLRCIGALGGRLASHNANLLMLAILVLTLDSPDPCLRAGAADVLAGVAEQRGTTLRGQLFANPKLLELVGRNLPSKPTLLAELADLLELSGRQLAQALLPHALPALVGLDDRKGLEGLARQAGLDPRRMLHDYGHYAVAKQLFEGSDSFDGFVAFTEAVMGQDFVVFVRSIMPRTIMEIVLQAGSASEWGSQVPIPDGILQRAASMLQELSSIACEGKENVSVAEFLSDGDHVTRTLKEFADSLERQLLPPAAQRPHPRIPSDPSSAVTVLRCVALLIQLTGPYIGRFLPQLMVLLTGALRTLAPREVKLQGLEGWLLLVKALAQHAQLQLLGIVHQVVVALLESLQEAGAVCGAGARVVEEVIRFCKASPEGRALLRGIPPLPHWMPELERANQVLAEERGQLTTEEHIQLLIGSLGDESVSVRATALQELKSFLSRKRDWLSRVLSGQADPKNQALLVSLMSVLLRCCDPERHTLASAQSQQACAECLGLLGAVDPSRLHLELQPPPPMCRTDGELVRALVVKHLVRLLKTASSLHILDAATFAIQELLKHYARHEELTLLTQQTQQGASREGTPVEVNALFSALPREIRAIVRPYLESKYSVVSSGKRALGVVFNPAISYRRWLSVWIEQLVTHFAAGDRLPLFRATITVFRHDVPTCLFLLPYLIHNAVALGGEDARQRVLQELEAVLRGGAASREGGLCLQTVFSLLDVLHKWGEEAKPARTQEPPQSGGPDSTPDSWEGVRQLLGSIPQDLLAQAASQCGAHARALQYSETYLRAAHGGGLNPAALQSYHYSDADVSFLQEVYCKLEEPDGLEGLVKLRRGGAKLEDQRLAAEKAGHWAEAATLYEQALQQGQREGGGGGGRGEGLSPTQSGYLGCLLHMGHLHGLLDQVEGMAGSCDDLAAVQLAALGTAASWRLSKWGPLEGYLRVVEEEEEQRVGGGLEATARWEVRLGQLLLAASKKDACALRRELDSARSEVMGPFLAAAMESYPRAYPHLVKLHMLQEVADVADLLQKPAGRLERQRLLRWDERLGVTQSSLATQEPILGLRRQLANLLGAGEEAGHCLLQLAKLCRRTGHFDAATNAVLEAMACKVGTAGLEHVVVLWEKGEQHRAITELQQLEAQLCPAGEGASVKAESSRVQAQVVLQLAEWMAATGQGVKEEITVLFERAASYDRQWEAVPFRYAVYLDQIMSDAKRRQQSADKPAGKLDRLGGKSRIRLGEDRYHLEYLPDVIRHYGSSMLHGHTFIYQALPRLLTLWFELGSWQQSQGALQQKERNVVTQVHNLVTDFAKRIPVHFWLTALPQLISRVCHGNKEVSDITKVIIGKILDGYPQQCLWALSVLAKSNVNARRTAFTAIVGQVRKFTSEATRKLITEHIAFWEQLVKLCHHNTHSKLKSFSARKEFSSLVRTMPLNILMPVMSALTVSLPAGGSIPKDWRYFEEPPVMVHGLMDEVELLASLQRPKKIKFIGSDGKQYCFLAKPKDDLRKDNRMMEAAGILNRLFVEEPGARRRNLYLRRFAVVPLTEEAGLVEWVPNTIGLRHCLQDVYGSEGLFSRNTNGLIRKTYDAFQGRRRSELLDKVLRMLPPRFHRWQLAKFPEPATWLNARLAFTRTAAVWCMVGHIVGLGDRHGENILIDASNGDVVHVDFSCLFDKGLTLEKPEMVPFRLTQNVIDGFGVTGTEGAYRRACEITLKVLRAHRATILSVMDTFVHDPLVEWSRGASRVDPEAENPMAKDAMATIDGRLSGTLLGVSSQPCLQLSVEGQAHRLVAEATDKENLGQMYIWWMPWM